MVENERHISFHEVERLSEERKESERLENLSAEQIQEEEKYYKKQGKLSMDALLDRYQVYHIGKDKSFTFARDSAWCLKQFVDCEKEKCEEEGVFRATTECTADEREALEQSIASLMEEYSAYSYFSPADAPVVSVDGDTGKLKVEGDPELVHHLQCLGLAHYFCIPAEKRIWDRKKTTRLHPLLMRLYACLPLFRDSLRDYPLCNYFGPHDPNQLYCFAMIMASWCNHTYWFINASSLLQFVMTPKDPHFHLYNHIHRMVDIYFDKHENFLVSLRTEGVFAHVGRMLTLRGLRYMYKKAYFTMGEWYRRSFITKEHPNFNLLYKWVLNHFLLRDTNPRFLKYACKVHPRTGEEVVDLHVLSLLLNSEDSTKGYFRHKESSIVEFVPNFFLMALDMFAVNSTLSKQMVSSMLHEFELDNQQLVSVINPALVPTPKGASKQERKAHKKTKKAYSPPDDRPVPPFYLSKEVKERQETQAECALRQNLVHFVDTEKEQAVASPKLQQKQQTATSSTSSSLEFGELDWRLIEMLEATEETSFTQQNLPNSLIQRNKETLAYQQVSETPLESQFYKDQQAKHNHPKFHRRPSTFSERVLDKHYDCSFLFSKRPPPRTATESFFQAIGSNVTAAASLVSDPFIKDEDFDRPYVPFADADHFDVNESRVIFGGPSVGYTMISTLGDSKKRKRAYFPSDFHRSNRLPQGFQLDLNCQPEDSEEDSSTSSPKRQCQTSPEHFDPPLSQIRTFCSFVKDEEVSDEEEEEETTASSSFASSSYDSDFCQDDDDEYEEDEPAPSPVRRPLRSFHNFDPDLPDEEDDNRPFYTMARRRAARTKDHDRSEDELCIERYESLSPPHSKPKERSDRFGGTKQFNVNNQVAYQKFVREPITHSPFVFRYDRNTDRLTPLLVMLTIMDYEVMRRTLVTHIDKVKSVPFCTLVDPTTSPTFPCTKYLDAASIDLPIHVKLAGSMRHGEMDVDICELASFHRTFYLQVPSGSDK